MSTKYADDGTPIATSSRGRTDNEPLQAPAAREPGDPEPGSISAAAAELARRRWANREEEGQAETPAPKASDEEAPTEDETPVADDPAEEQESDDTDGSEDGGEVEETEETEAPEEESEQDDPAEEETGPLSLDEEATVTINGEEWNVGELVKGNLREQDYTRRTQALSTQRQALTQREQAVAAHFGMQEQAISDAIRGLDQNTDWAELAKTDPNEYHARRAQRDGLGMELQQMQHRTQGFLQRIEQIEKEARAEAAKIAQSELKRDIQGWNQALYYSLIDFAETEGFSRHEVLQYTDAKIFKLLRKAKLYDEAQKVGTKKVVKPGAKRTVRATASSPMQRVATKKSAAKVDEMRDQAKKSGSVDDAMALLRAKRNG